MAVTDFDTKVAVVVREDLATWQRLNLTAFLMSGITPRRRGRDRRALPRCGRPRVPVPLLVQPVVVFSADRSKLHTARERAQRRGLHVALYTADTASRCARRARQKPPLRFLGGICVTFRTSRSRPPSA